MSDRLDAELTWSPSRGLVVVLWVGAALASAWFVALTLSHADPAGQVLACFAALGLLVGAVFGVRARPRLLADADGLTVRGLLRAHHFPWPLVQRVELRTVRRWGRPSTTLEIDSRTADGREHLVVLGRFDLGTDPLDVAEQVSRLRAP